MLIAIILVAAAASLLVPTVRWRVQLVYLMAAGQIPDLEWRDLVTFMLPNSPQPMARLVDTRNPYAVIRNPYAAPADVAAGAVAFRDQCMSCHEAGGRGGVGPALIGREFTHGESDWAIYRTIRYGVPNTAMPPHPLPATALWQMIAYIRSLDASNVAIPAAPPAIDKAVADIPYEEIRAVEEPASDWLTYSGSYRSTRHSALTKIDPNNVDQLAVRWIREFADVSSPMEVSPLVRHGIMYVSQRQGLVVALDAATGKTLWSFNRKIPSDAIGGEKGALNRGVAILNDKVFVGTTDAHLVALSATTGKLVWDNAITNYKDGYLITAAPLAFRDMIVTGVATNPAGRAFVVAYDAETGKERWRFYAIPAPGEAGNDTWSGDSWKSGGAPTWMTGSYDADLDLLYWAVGNPKPDYDTAVRKGDNLYTNAVVALRGSTGQLVWYFQFTPADEHDWDANQIPVLVDRVIDGQPRKLMLWANRNGFYYVLDRESGKFLHASPFVQQNWADGIDKNGRPIRSKLPDDTHKGVMIYPSNAGATSWWSPSFDPAHDLMIVPTLERGMVFFPGDNDDDEKSAAFSWPTATNKPFYTALRALDALTGKLVWEYRRKPRLVDPDIGGALSTKSGVVFGSDQTSFFALSAENGAVLWSFDTGGKIRAAPVTYEANGEQYVVIPAGHDLLSFGLPKRSTNTSLR